MPQPGTIRTSAYVNTAKLFNATTGALIATALSVAQEGDEAAFKRVVFDGVPAGNYSLSLFLGVDALHTGIDVTVAADSWQEVVQGAGWSPDERAQIRYRLGLDGSKSQPATAWEVAFHTFTVSMVPSVVVPAPTEVVASDLWPVFGKENIDKWSDLENNGNPGSMAARVNWAISLAIADVQGAMDTSAYNWDVVKTDVRIKHLIVTRVGVLLYGPRGVSDEDAASNPIRDHKKEYDKIIQMIHAGTYRLSGKKRTGASVPIVVTEDE